MSTVPARVAEVVSRQPGTVAIQANGRSVTYAQFWDEARAFAFGEYAAALVKGNRLTRSEVSAVAQKLARYTGLSADYLERSNLRVSAGRYRKELLREQRLAVGRLDSRFTTVDLDAAGETPEFDPSNTALAGPYVAAFSEYVRDTLEWKSDLSYPTSGNVRPWSWDEFENQYMDMTEELRAAMSRNPADHAGPPGWILALQTVAAIVGLILAGRFLLRPLFRLIGNWNEREMFVFAGLFTVIASAAVMELLGLSTALGAFIAGVMLADSPYRHELEADVEPFRSILLGLFFLAVGMMLDLPAIAERPLFVAAMAFPHATAPTTNLADLVTLPAPVERSPADTAGGRRRRRQESRR